MFNKSFLSESLKERGAVQHWGKLKNAGSFVRARQPNSTAYYHSLHMIQ